MKLLAVETATDACSVAVTDGHRVHAFHELAARRHAEMILPAIQRLLADARLRLSVLDAIVLGRGPGSFTGVRIAAAVCQGLALGAGLPVVPVSSLATLAQGAVRRHGWQRVLVAHDARMGEIYAGAFELAEDGVVRLHGGEQVCAPGSVSAPAGDGWQRAGSAWAVHGEALHAVLGPCLGTQAVDDALPMASDALALGRVALQAGLAVPPAEAQPVYLRDRVTSAPRQA